MDRGVRRYMGHQVGYQGRQVLLSFTAGSSASTKAVLAKHVCSVSRLLVIGTTQQRREAGGAKRPSSKKEKSARPLLGVGDGAKTLIFHQSQARQKTARNGRQAQTLRSQQSGSTNHLGPLENASPLRTRQHRPPPPPDSEPPRRRNNTKHRAPSSGSSAWARR